MKKILLLLGMSMVFFCGCESLPEETGTLDYEKMDREFGQIRDEYVEVEDDSAQFEDEMDELSDVVEEYSEMLIEKDAEALAESFPESFVEAISNENGCNYDVAKGIAAEKIAENFNKSEYKYRELLEMWDDYSHKTEIKRIDLFSQRSTLKAIYKGFGVDISESVDIEFTISAGGVSEKGEIRLVKLESGDWVVDMSFFEI